MELDNEKVKFCLCIIVLTSQTLYYFQKVVEVTLNSDLY